jgi:hypothetical protein
MRNRESCEFRPKPSSNLHRLVISQHVPSSTFDIGILRANCPAVQLFDQGGTVN